MKVGLRRLVAIMIAFALVLSYIPKSGLTLYNVHAEDSTITIVNSDFSSDIWGDNKGWNTTPTSWNDTTIETCIYASKDGLNSLSGSEKGVSFWSKSVNTIEFTQDIFIPAGSYKFTSVNMGKDAAYNISIDENVSDTVNLSGWNIWDNTSLYFSTDEDISNATLKITVNISAGGWGYLDSITAESIDNQEYNNATTTEEQSTTEDTAINNAEITVKKVDNLSDDFALGTDISAIHSIYESGAYCKDYNGNRLSEAQFFSFLKKNGVNWVRIRVWNNPFDANGKGYGGGNNDINAAVTMGKLATNAGLKVLIDFHYSDFWADPAKQQAPKAWSDYTLEEKANAVKTFTKESLTTLKNAGVDVKMVQIGNETNGKICGESGFTNMSQIFNAGSSAVREVFRDALVALHFTDPQDSGKQAGYAKSLYENNVDYDVFASSYYPYWHGSLSNLKSVLGSIASTYNKKVMVAETSYAWTLEDGDGHENTVRVGNNDSVSDCIYPYTVEGQAAWVRDVVDTVNSIDDSKGIGVFYWEAAWIPVGNYATSTNKAATLASNKAKWEQYGSGWASSYSSEYDPDDAGRWYGGSSIDNQAFFDFDGKAINSLKVYKYMSTGSKQSEITANYVNPTSVSVYYSDALKNAVVNALPANVEVVLSDMSTVSDSVVWSEADINKIIGIGTYTVRGSLGTYDGLIPTCTVNVKPENMLTNAEDPSFENGGSGWTFEGVAKVTNEDPHDGTKTFHYWNETAGEAKAYRTVTLPAGSYTFKAYAQGYANDTGYIYVNVDDEITKGEYTLQSWQVWQEPSLTFTLEKETELEIGIVADYQASGWGSVDDLYIYKSDVSTSYNSNASTSSSSNSSTSTSNSSTSTSSSESSSSSSSASTANADIPKEAKAVSSDANASSDATGNESADATQNVSADAQTNDDTATNEQEDSKATDSNGEAITPDISSDAAIDNNQSDASSSDAVYDKKSNAEYKVDEKSGSNGVDYISPANNKAKTCSVPDTVVVNGKKYKVTTIKNGAFKNNSKVVTIKVGKNVSKIESYAFKNCSKLKTIVIKSKKITSKSLSKNAFKGISKKTTIKVPKDKLKTYKKLFRKNGLSNKVKIKAI